MKYTYTWIVVFKNTLNTQQIKCHVPFQTVVKQIDHKYEYELSKYRPLSLLTRAFRPFLQTENYCIQTAPGRVAAFPNNGRGFIGSDTLKVEIGI